MKVLRINSVQPQKQNIRQNSKANVVFEKALSTKRVKTFFIDLYRKIFPYGLSGPRKLPNFITAPEDCVNVVFKQIKYFPEDVKKMKNMDVDTRIAYKQKLMSEGKYILPDDV